MPCGWWDELANVLRHDPHDMELPISYGTSKGGSAGRLALAIRDQAPGDDLGQATCPEPATGRRANGSSTANAASAAKTCFSVWPETMPCVS